MTATKLTGILIAGLAILTTACGTAAPIVPDGTYWSAHGYQPDSVIIKDGKVAYGSMYDGSPIAFTADDIEYYSKENRGFAVITPNGLEEYCPEDTIPYDRIAQLAKDADPQLAPPYAKCSARHGWQITF
jgi:hypothetical protein